MILDKKREEKLTEEEAEAEAQNMPEYLTEACPACGSFTLFQISDEGDVECDTCGEEVRQSLD